MRTYDVRLYFTTCSFARVLAESEEEAIAIAEESWTTRELIDNLVRWREEDSAEMVRRNSMRLS